MAENIKPDAFGWLRVKDEDSGHELSVQESQFAHGRFTVLKAQASDPNTGEPLPPKHNTKSAASTSGQSASTEKES